MNGFGNLYIDRWQFGDDASTKKFRSSSAFETPELMAVSKPAPLDLVLYSSYSSRPNLAPLRYVHRVSASR